MNPDRMNPDLMNLRPLTSLFGFKKHRARDGSAAAAAPRQNPPNARGSIRCSTLSWRMK